MDLLIILTYTALCIAVFKIFAIPLNKWTVPTAVLGGVAMLTGLMLLMNYNHPYAKYGKDVFVTIPIVPQISGTVKTVYARTNQPVKRGDVLFTLENDTQQLALEKAEAALQEAKISVAQNDQSLATAMNKAAQAKAEYERTKLTFERYREGMAKGGEFSPFTQQELDNREQRYEAARAGYAAATAEEQRVLLRTKSQINGEDTLVAQLIAARDKAQVDLDRTFIRAPMDGTPTQLSIRPGIRAASLPLRPVMSFIPKEKRRFIALFWQNSLQRLEKGLDAEVILDAVPGHVFSGKVVDVLPAMSEGEMQSVGSLLSANNLMRHGFAIGVIELDEDLNSYNLPLGVQGQAVAINKDNDYLHVSMIRRILLRMMSWLKYVYPIK